MSKRGRKPSVNNKNYFTEREEDAIIRFLTSDDADYKNKIFMDILYPAFVKMIESIIRRYKLFVPDEPYDDTFCDTLSFLFTKLEKFKPGRFKAYSYYGTICKNYLMGKIQTFNKSQERNPLHRTVPGGFNSLRYSDYEDEKNCIASEIVKDLTVNIKKMLEQKDDIPLKESEIKLGKSLINLFENWDYILTTDGSPKLNKSAVLFFLKESTGLDAKGIRDNIKKYKIEYLITKNDITEEYN